MANDGLEHRESGRGPPEGRGAVSLQQHQQVWLCPKTLKSVQSEGLGLGIGWGRKGDRKSRPTPRCWCACARARASMHRPVLQQPACFLK